VHGLWGTGVAATLTCSRDCLATARVQLNSRAVGRRSVRLWAGEPRHVVIRLRRAAAARLRLVLTAVDAAGRRADVERTVLSRRPRRAAGTR
jgi:hypothetical protein